MLILAWIILIFISINVVGGITIVLLRKNEESKNLAIFLSLFFTVLAGIWAMATIAHDYQTKFKHLTTCKKFNI